MLLLNWVLVSVCMCLAATSYAAYKRGHANTGIILLMVAAGSLRLVLIQLDPFLHDWDERFHALVAKNLQMDWLKPVLRANPVLPYDYRAWGSNHVWLHKQPLFLWQMALSMRIFGVNEIALRFPSALLGTLILWPVYRLGKLIFSTTAGYYAALLMAFSYYQLELTTGWQSVDHSDVAFLAYVTASVWCYYESRQPSSSPWRWSMLAGLFAGAAVLCKWLPGLVVYSAWAFDVVTDVHRRRQVREYGRLVGSALITAIICLPWQFYTHYRFPLESAFEAQYAARHFSQVLEGQGGPWYFYLTHNLWYQYQWLVLLIGGGLGILFTTKMRNRPVGPLLIVCSVLFGFYSAALTKMPSYTYVVAPCVLLIAALAWARSVEWLNYKMRSWNGLTEVIMLVTVLTIDARPYTLLKHHTEQFATPKTRLERQTKIRHTAIFRHLNELVPPGYIVFNTASLAEIEAMFYSQRNVYSWWPSEAQYRELRGKGLHLAVFPDHNEQTVPIFLHEAGVMQIPASLK